MPRHRGDLTIWTRPLVDVVRALAARGFGDRAIANYLNSGYCKRNFTLEQVKTCRRHHQIPSQTKQAISARAYRVKLLQQIEASKPVGQQRKRLTFAALLGPCRFEDAVVPPEPLVRATPPGFQSLTGCSIGDTLTC